MTQDIDIHEIDRHYRGLFNAAACTFALGMGWATYLQMDYTEDREYLQTNKETLCVQHAVNQFEDALSRGQELSLLEVKDNCVADVNALPARSEAAQGVASYTYWPGILSGLFAMGWWGHRRRYPELNHYSGRNGNDNAPRND